MKTSKNPLNGRGTAMIAAAPITFGVCEAAFHANPIVGGALAILAGAIAYRHFDDVTYGIEGLKEGALVNYAPRQEQSSSEPVKPKSRDKSKIILGRDKRDEERGRALEALKNILILGLPGLGKSTLACWLLSQMIEQGARVIIIDRHARSDESLTAMLSPFESRFLMQPAYQYQDMEQAIDLAENLLNERIEGRLIAEYPIILVVDEFTDLMKKATRRDEIGNIVQRLADTVEAYNAMGRKYKCFSLCIGQLSNASRTGGTEIRELFATKLLCSMQETQARLVLPKEIASRVARLNVGECIVQWEGKEEPFRVRFPKKSRNYYQDIARSLPKVQKNTFQAQNDDNDPEAEVEASREVGFHYLGSETTSTLRTIAKRVRSGEKFASIRKDYGLPESGRAMQEVNEALRWIGDNMEDENQ